MAFQPVHDFAVLLRRHRLLAGLSQEALAERAALSVRGISDLERGVRRAPHPATIARLADALGLAAAQRGALLLAGTRPSPQRIVEEQPPLATEPPKPAVVAPGEERRWVTVLAIQ